MRWLALLTLIGCAESPVGSWQGTLVFSTDDGQEFRNSLRVDGDQTARATLYFIAPDPEDAAPEPAQLLFYSDWTADWDASGGVAEFAMACSAANCEQRFLLVCEIEDPGLRCDAAPDFYADDASALLFEPTP